jgi:hypothetical protein
MNEHSHEISPSTGVMAHNLERQLREIDDALASVERHFTQEQRGQTPRSDAIAIAREHIRAAIDALELASQE